LSASLCGCGSDGDNTADEDQPTKAAKKTVGPADIPLPKYDTGTLRVYTQQAGFVVVIDGEPVRNADGELLTTPCRVTTTKGNHTIVVAKREFQDASAQVSVSENESELVLEPVADLGGENSLLNAPYWNAEVGKPIALETLNTPAKELDPYISPDGTTLLFVSDRREGTGVYTASRSSAFHAFDEPELLQLSRGSDLPATPSVTGDSLTVVYALPAKGRVRALQKTSTLGDYDEKTAIRYTTSDTAVWPAAQILSDGLRLYWTEVDNGKSTIYSSSRKSTDLRFSKTFIVAMPGGFPCLSHDGLRQYAFDGKTLARARRKSSGVKLSDTETIAQLDLSNYVKSADRRQYYVSDDEQWMFYADDPASGGDLHVVRFADHRGWGHQPTGESIAPRTVVAEVRPKKKDPGSEDFVPDVFVDPRILPLAYTKHWKRWRELVEARQYAAADTLTRKNNVDAEFSNEKNLLAWDLKDLSHIQNFWKDVRSGISQLKPEEPFRIRGARLEFVRFEKDVLVGSLSGKEVSKPIVELSPVDLLQFADKVIDKNDQAAQLRAGMFLYFDPKGLKRSTDLRFERAGDLEGDFIERLAARISQQAEHEFDRENYGPGLAFVRQLREFAPRSDAARRADQLEQELYIRMKWQTVGRRQWKQAQPGEFIAEAGRVADSYLLSPKRYENFELRLEWKTSQPQPLGAGGVFFRYSRLPGEQPYTADAAFKIQLSNDYGVPADSRATGALFGESAPRINAVQPTDKWNALVLRVIRQTTTVTINRRKVLETTAVNEEIPLKGYIALDGITGGISYRKVLLMELPSGVPKTSAKQ
jgi:hypothetical protein